MKLDFPINFGIAMAGAVAFASTVALTDVVKAADHGPLPEVKIDAKKAALGKRLFFDKRLSGDASMSCATCHMPEKAFSDGLQLSKAYPGSDGFRNTPSLINTVFKKSWFWDGHLGTNLNDVTRESITEDYVMNMDMRIMQERLKQDPVYVKMFKDAGYGEPSNGSVRKAIPEYFKTLTSRGSPFDTGTMTDAAKRGYALFDGKAGCSRCHTGSNFSDGKPYNTGVPNNPAIWRDPMRHHTYVAFGLFMGIDNLMNLRRDVGSHVLKHKADRSDYGQFITPGLRELTSTAPYMHNGMLATLVDVVIFYNNGGGSDANMDPMIKKLGLTDAEQSDLVAFLEALSGDPLTGPDHVWKDPIPANYKPIADWVNVKN